jgi:phage tail-like protein
MPYRGNESVFKYNYVETIKELVPDIYLNEDLKNGYSQDSSYQVIGSYVLFANEYYNFFSSVSGLSSSGIIQRFNPSNKYTNVDANVYEEYVLSRFGRELKSFPTSSSFYNYVVSTVLPNTHLNSISDAFMRDSSGSRYNAYNTPGDVHRSLVSGLGLAYFLNTTSVSDATTQLSSVLASSLAYNIYYGHTFDELEAAKVIAEYLWRNRDDVESFRDKYLPAFYASAASAVSGEAHASGIHQLDAYKTQLGVWLNSFDVDSGYIGSALDLMASSNRIKTLYDSAGPLQKFLKGTSFGFYEVEDVVESMQDLFDIEKCPAPFLEYLSQLIGWRFLGGDVSQWRAQLRQAVYTYKAKGTRQSLQDAISYVFPQEVSSFSPSGDMHTCYESYLPYLIYYAIKTASPLGRDEKAMGETLLQLQANPPSGITINYDPLDHDKNIRFCVDAIMEFIHLQTSFIDVNGQRDMNILSNGKGWLHRGNFVVAVPPWEKDTFYKTTRITEEVLSWLYTLLTDGCFNSGYVGFGFGIDDWFVDALGNYIRDYTNLGTEVSGQFYFGDNNKLKFFTSGSHNPPNFSSVIASGISDELSVVDYWNTRSSYLFIKLPDNAFEGTTPLNKGDISRIAITAEEFTPLHVVSRIYAGKTLEDSFKAFNMADAGLGIRLRQALSDECTNVYHSYNTSGFVGTHGQGGLWRLVRTVRPYTTPIKTGKFLPTPDEPNFCRYDAPGWGDLYSGSGYNLSAQILNASGDPDMITGDYIPPIYLRNAGGTGISTAASAGSLWRGERRWRAATNFGFFTSRLGADTSGITVSAIDDADYVKNGGSLPDDIPYQLISSANGTAGNIGTDVTFNPYWFRAGQKYNISFYYKAAPYGGTADQAIKFCFKQGRPYGSNDYEDTPGFLVAKGDSTWGETGTWHYHSSNFTAPTEPVPWNPLGVPSSLAGAATYGSDYDEKSSVYIMFRSHQDTGGSPTNSINGVCIAGLNISPMYWEVSGNLDRYDTTRRNYKYVVKGWDAVRNGIAQPYPMGLFSTSAITSLETTTDFIPKGFNFSGQNYISPHVNTLSSIYDSSNSPLVENNAIYSPAPSGTILNYPISSTFPARSMQPLDVSSDAEFRTNFTNTSKQIYIDYNLRQGRIDRRFLFFSQDEINDSSFSGMHDVWNVYRATSGFDWHLDGSGFAVLDHSYGPGLFNNTFSQPGAFASSAVSGFPAFTLPEGNQTAKLGEGQFRSTIGSDGILGTGFLNAQGFITPFLEKGILFANGVGSYVSPLDQYIYPGESVFSNDMFFSGVSIAAHDMTTAVAVRSIGDLQGGSCDFFGTSSLNNNSLTVFGGKDPYTNSSYPLKVRFPLVREGNLLTNGTFDEAPRSDKAMLYATTSSLLSWRLLDGERRPDWSGGATAQAKASVVRISPTSPSAFTVVQLQSDRTPAFANFDGSGALRSAMTGISNEQFGATRNPFNLNPLESYTLSMEVSSSETSGGVGYALYNSRNKLFYKASDSSWTTDATFNRSTPVNASAFYTVSSNIFIPVSSIGKGTTVEYFSPTNEYNLTLMRHPESNLDEVVKSENVKSLSLLPNISNKLLADRNYNLSFSADYADPTGSTSLDGLAIRVFAGPDNNANSSTYGDLFEFDFRSRRWTMVNAGETNSPGFVRLNTGPQEKTGTFDIDFHTMNSLGPMDEMIRQPMYVNHGSKYRNIHDLDLPYTLEITPILPSRQMVNDAQRPYIRLYNLNLVDSEMRANSTYFTRFEAKRILKYFNTLKDTLVSRNETTRTDLALGPRGGSRTLYLELYGGKNRETDSGGCTIYDL